VQDIFGHGDEVVVRLVVTGTQEGPLLGIPATGRHLIRCRAGPRDSLS
jgi:predicted ester cyclase